MLQYSQCKIDYRKDTREELHRKVAKDLRIKEQEIYNLCIEKKSIDARKKPEIYYNYTVSFAAEDEAMVLRKNKNNRNLKIHTQEPDLLHELQKQGISTNEEKIVIVGAGPAGLLCGYLLAQCGKKPFIVERGGSVSERVEKVASFWKKGELDPETNVSFGEGGAGTFSDGKLNTGVKDKTGKKQYILRTFVEHGAPEEIQYLAKPHIGTDKLRQVLVSMRESIENLGGSYRFHAKVIGFVYHQEDEGKRRISAVRIENESGKVEEIPCDRVVLAIGHSARDTFEMLRDEDVAMEPKPFAVGVRVEHLQKKINESQYGVNDVRLPAADYKLTGKTKDDRGVYSFCMCPGGYVVNASSEPGMTVVNGMSDHARDSKMANSAIIVTVDCADFGGEDVLAGVEFQRKLERKAYEAGKGKIPAQRWGDFKEGIVTTHWDEEDLCTKGEIVMANLKKILPSYISNGIMDGMEQFGKKIRGFDDADTWILGTETRTSSPVRILRKETFESVNVAGVYPCGEGAGYAGGIMSAAMDGLRVAVQIVSERKEEEHEK